MPSFDTPEPVSATIEIVGPAQIVASKRTDTVVEVRPMNPDSKKDVQAAEETKVTFSGGKLTVMDPKVRSVIGRKGLVEVSIQLPAGSELNGVSALGDFLCEGRFGPVRLKTATGNIQIDEAASVWLRTPLGDVLVDQVTGDAEVQGGGRVRIGRIDGTASIKNLNGETALGEVDGDLTVKSSNGSISVVRAGGSVDAKSANGSIRVDEVRRGRVTLQTAAGGLEVGIPTSTAAWLDVRSKAGRVRNELGAAEGPAEAEETVEVRGRTSFGDIVIRRA
ncbi:DUF4097 family beta strand repeat-containing protein [Streptomyces sp. NBC_01304]|uniref:DUF4097 family beta strand repeat-containing protein n=1 Tax=Streptomyces sp. NBC_01304 TaxID=2903818 RepID=UPI002E11C277|nr:DUF4097 family beta strand repeat-containing protein [Streptomyces sp. NBC_01304]